MKKPSKRYAERLANHPVFSQMSGEELQLLLARAATREIHAHEHILEEGLPATTVYVLLSGSARVYIADSQGKQYAPIFLTPPAIMGEIEALTGIPLLESVSALERSEVLGVPKEDFLLALNSSSAMAKGLLFDVVRRFCVAIENERSLAFDNVKTRLGRLLNSFAASHGEETPEGRKIRVPLTQDDMADALAVRRRVVCREIATWQKEGALARTGRHYVVCDSLGLHRHDDSGCY